MVRLLKLAAMAGVLAGAAAQTAPFMNKTSIRVCTSETTPSKQPPAPRRTSAVWELPPQLPAAAV